MGKGERVRFVLKTKYGFLTANGGSVINLDDDNVLILNIVEAGGLNATKEERVENFLKHCSTNIPILAHPLLKQLNDCQILRYDCKSPTALLECRYCASRSNCEFITHRSEKQLALDY